MGLFIKNNIVTGSELEKDVTVVVIPDGVKEISKNAFYKFREITSVTIPDTVTKIGSMAFFRCAKLTKLRIPERVTNIGDLAFEGCSNLVTNLSIKQWNQKYGLSKMDYALNYMRNYRSGDPFFDDVKTENNRYIKSQRERLIRKTTSNDEAVVSYMAREGWLSIDDIDHLLEKFRENVEITALLLDYKHKNFTDEYLEQRETDKFEKEVGIKERTLAEWKKIYLLCEDNEGGGYTLKHYIGTDTEISIPDHIAGKPVTRIGQRCFSPRSTKRPDLILVREKIKSVYIPDTVTCIEQEAFKECSSLTDIIIPNSVTTIGRGAFNLCRSLTEVTLSESLVTIPYGLFSVCDSLTQIKIPSSVEYIEEYAFSSCSRLTEIDIPDNVKEIAGGAFCYCRSLQRVTLPKGLKEINDSLFIKCEALTKIEIPESVPFIGRFAFCACSSLTEITIPKGVTSIEPSAFEKCKKLERVNLSDGLESIFYFAFAECPNLREITIPASVKSIYDESFRKTKVVITAPRGSYAIKFAKENGYKFKELPT